MKLKVHFLGEKVKNMSVINSSSAEFFQRVVKLKETRKSFHPTTTNSFSLLLRYFFFCIDGVGIPKQIPLGRTTKSVLITPTENATTSRNLKSQTLSFLVWRFISECMSMVIFGYTLDRFLR